MTDPLDEQRAEVARLTQALIQLRQMVSILAPEQTPLTDVIERALNGRPTSSLWSICTAGKVPAGCHALVIHEVIIRGTVVCGSEAKALMMEMSRLHNVGLGFSEHEAGHI